MAQLVTIDNFPKFNLVQVGELTADVAAGAISLPVSTETGYDTTHAVLIGEPGDETTEIAIPSLVADNALTVPAIDNDHSKGEKVYKLRGHKARVYRATKVNGACPIDDASYTAQAIVSLVPDSTETEWNDPTGNADTHCWIYTFYNDIPGTPEETQLDPSEAYAVSDFVVTVDEVRDEAGFNRNTHISESQILSKIRLAQGEANSAAVMGGYTIPVEDAEGVFKNAVLLLAAGYLMTKEWGYGWRGINEEGKAKLAEGKALLKRIEDGSITLVGVDVETQRQAVMGYPLDIDTEDDDVQPFFSVKDKF